MLFDEKENSILKYVNEIIPFINDKDIKLAKSAIEFLGEVVSSE